MKAKNWKTELGEKITALRNRIGYSQAEIADKIGVDSSYVSKIERGYIPITNKEIIPDIAHVVKVPTNVLYKGRLSECFEAQNSGR